jgi:two-component system sensor histidine kinase VicK
VAIAAPLPYIGLILRISFVFNIFCRLGATFPTSCLLLMLPPSALNAELASLRAEVAALHAQLQQRHTDHPLAAQVPPLGDYDAQSQVRFRTVFENSPLGQKIIAPDLTIRQANLALVAMLGCTHAGQVEGRRILDFAHPQYRADWHHLQQQLWTHQLPYFTLDTCLVRVDGSLLWCQVHSILFPDQDQTLGYTTLIDTTTHTELQASLKRLYDSQETILHLVAHDVRNPLAHIKLAVELLRRDQGGDTPKFLTIIEQAAGQAEAILQDVLYIGQLEAGQLHKQPVDFGAYLDAQLAAHRLAAHAKGVTLELEVPPHGVQVNLNPNKFGRVVNNLLSNALKFTPTGGRVRVCLSEHGGRPRLTRCRTRAWAFPPRTRRTSSTSSAKPLGRAWPASPRRAWAYLSRSNSCACTGVSSGWKAAKTRAPPFLLTCKQPAAVARPG